MNGTRYFLKLAYNGSSFHGWQSQINAHTVQKELENCLSLILQNKEISVTGAGRTDTGVHARVFYAHFDYYILLTATELKHLMYRLNHVLPDSIAVQEIFAVKSDVHARFSAISRTYRYYICRTYDPFAVGMSYKYTVPLNIELMQKAAILIKDYTDFTCFAKTGTQTTTNICTIYESEWVQEGNMLIYKTKANRYLRNMVRAMVGTLIDVGKEKLTLAEFTKILQNGTRSDAGQSVPACGLFLEDVEYPDDIRLL
ncbi:MAG: tRNA pseudouridine(38-40) synthase TruA [Lentimicrobiaceae bacterium]